MSESNTTAKAVDYVKFQQKPEFQALRRKQRAFVFPMAVFFLAWYFTFVLLAANAPEFMGTPLIGAFNVGLFLGLLQFITTFVITMLYVRFANQRLDALGAELRAELQSIENGELAQ